MRNIVFLLFLIIPTLANAQTVHKERSLYRNILVEDTYDLRCLRFNVKSSKTNQSCMYKSNPQKMVFNYTKLLFSSLLALEEAPKSVLILGLGGGTMSNAIHQLYPEARVDNIDIDPAVIKVARKYFAFIENEKITASAQDARIYVKRAGLKKKSYDWIILDAFNGDYIPEHLMTKEFLEETKALLTPNGVLSANTFSISRLYDYESETYHQVFGDFFNIRNLKNSNRVILATNRGLPSAQHIDKRARLLREKLKPFDVDIVAISTYMTSTADEKDWPDGTKPLTDQFSPANLLNQ